MLFIQGHRAKGEDGPEGDGENGVADEVRNDSRKTQERRHIEPKPTTRNPALPSRGDRLRGTLGAALGATCDVGIPQSGKVIVAVGAMSGHEREGRKGRETQGEGGKAATQAAPLRSPTDAGIFRLYSGVRAIGAVG